MTAPMTREELERELVELSAQSVRATNKLWLAKRKAEFRRDSITARPDGRRSVSVRCATVGRPASRGAHRMTTLCERERALEVIRAFGRALSSRQLNVLREMRDAEIADNLEDAEIVQEGRECYRGLVKISPATVAALLRACAISRSQVGSQGVDYYHINETGKQILEDR